MERVLAKALNQKEYIIYIIYLYGNHIPGFQIFLTKRSIIKK